MISSYVLPINLLAENAPVYDRKWKKTKLPQKLKIEKDDFKSLNLNDCLKNHENLLLLIRYVMI